jgi:hypothetical protein
MNWRTLLGSPTTIPPGCPGVNCGWRDPITIALLARATYQNGMMIGKPATTGRLLRCPICGTMYVELADKVQRCGVAPADQPRPAPKDVTPTERPRNYPAVDDDMVHGFNAREPR